MANLCWGFNRIYEKISESLTERIDFTVTYSRIITFNKQDRTGDKVKDPTALFVEIGIVCYNIWLGIGAKRGQFNKGGIEDNVELDSSVLSIDKVSTVGAEGVSKQFVECG